MKVTFVRGLTVVLGLVMLAGGPIGRGGDPVATKPVKPSTTKKPTANNSACMVCHINFQEEELATLHAKGNVGCVKCHGKSIAHTDDESNLTPPEIMFTKDQINPACLKCHPGSKLSDGHKAVLAGTEPKDKHCTDCHGEHQMSHRTRLWDKKTGKLLPESKKI